MNTALLIIDFTNDFIAEDGKLTIYPSNIKSTNIKPANIEAEIVKNINFFKKNGDYVITANDYHNLNDVNHPEFKLFVPHNVDDYGRELFGDVKTAVEKISSNRLITINKNRYSAFVGTDLELKLRERNINELYLCGVATSICVLQTTIDAYNKGFKINILKDACADITNEEHVFAIEYMDKILGANIC